MEILIIKLIAILVAIFIGHCIACCLIDKLDEIRGETRGEPGKKIAKYLGFFERGITVAIWFWGKPEFIGIWFLGKVVGDWKRREKEHAGAFSSFLLATGISILFAISVAILANWIIKTITKI